MQSGFFSEEETSPKEYQVLARKYRPQTFEDMIGQEVLVRTLTNAINSERIAHSFILTGIRGVGKTTTARIIAKAMNCIGNDVAKPTATPCGKCIQCISIAEGRSQDVLEMDAASHTGVNDIREIIDNSRYRPISSRFKIYIIDEVHMLSNSAFNALLKTLEEPPSHVKFIFATTEIRKIPITILSRCQRFDLRRVEGKDLTKHYARIIEQEGFKADDNSIRLIANAAGGSVRDGLSMLDQALALSEGTLTEDIVREMLGLADIEHVFNLYEQILLGDIKATLSLSKDLFSNGADPILILQDLLKINYTTAKLKSAGDNKDLAELELEFCKKLADKLDMSYLARSWQMMLKGLDEVKHSHDPYASFEMVLIRLAYSATLPTPEEAIRSMQPDNSVNEKKKPSEQQQLVEPQAEQGPANKNIKVTNFEDVLNTLYEADEMMVYHQLKSDVQFVKIEEQKLYLKLINTNLKGLPENLSKILTASTGSAWQVILTAEQGQETIAAQEMRKELEDRKKIADHPAVQEVLNTFTEVEILDIKSTKTE